MTRTFWCPLGECTQPFQYLADNAGVRRAGADGEHVPFDGLLADAGYAFPDFVVYGCCSVRGFYVGRRVLVFVLDKECGKDLPLQGKKSSDRERQPIALVLRVLRTIRTSHQLSLLFTARECFRIRAGWDISTRESVRADRLYSRTYVLA